MKRILFIAQDFPPAVGGIQTYSESLAAALARQASSLHVLAPGQLHDRSFDATQPYPVHRHPFPADAMRLTVLPELMVLTKRHRFDTILTSGWYTAAPALVARRFGFTGRLFTAAHGQEVLSYPMPVLPKTVYQRHRQWVFTSVDGAFPVSHYTGGLLKKLGLSQHRIHVVPNGVDLAQWDALRGNLDLAAFRKRHNIAADARVVGTVCRLISRKGVDTVLRAMPEILAGNDQVHYVIGGEGPEKARLQDLAGALKIKDKCTFLGRVDRQDIAALYETMDMFVMPAREEPPSVEGFGLVYREANLFGKPVIGTPVGGINDAVLDGKTGLLVPKNDASALARAVLKLLFEPALARQLGASGRALIEREGTWDHVAAKMMVVLESV